jgi:predicted transcriptional regulator
MSSTEMRQWRRKRAWDLKQQGWKQRDIAHALGVSEGAVSQWLKQVRAKDDLRSRRDVLIGSIRHCGYLI